MLCTNDGPTICHAEFAFEPLELVMGVDVYAIARGHVAHADSGCVIATGATNIITFALVGSTVAIAVPTGPLLDVALVAYRVGIAVASGYWGRVLDTWVEIGAERRVPNNAFREIAGPWRVVILGERDRTDPRRAGVQHEGATAAADPRERELRQDVEDRRVRSAIAMVLDRRHLARRRRGRGERNRHVPQLRVLAAVEGYGDRSDAAQAQFHDLCFYSSLDPNRWKLTTVERVRRSLDDRVRISEYTPERNTVQANRTVESEDRNRDRRNRRESAGSSFLPGNSPDS